MKKEKLHGKKEKLIILIIVVILISLVTFSARFLNNISNSSTRTLLIILINYFNALIAFVALKITGFKLILDLKNGIQFIYGIIIALCLWFSLGLIPVLCGTSLAGGPTLFNTYEFIYNLFFYFVVIGPVEELIFRVYVQDTLIDLLPKAKVVGVIIASLLFGVWHLITGSVLQVVITSFIGLVFGLSKFYIKKFNYLGVSFSHSLYDFSLYVLTLFIK